MRTTGKKQAFRNAIFRLGLHATTMAVVHALAQQGIEVNEEFVRQVRFGMLKESAEAWAGKVAGPVPGPAVRRCPKGFARAEWIRSGPLPLRQQNRPRDSSSGGVCMNGTAGREQSKSGGEASCTLRAAS
jgi:hypothetical protein